MQGLKEETDIDIESIVSYKDDTHVFFMTAERYSLLKKWVVKDVRGQVEKR